MGVDRSGANRGLITVISYYHDYKQSEKAYSPFPFSQDVSQSSMTGGPTRMISRVGDGDDEPRGFRFSMTGGPVRMISRVADGAGAGSRGFKMSSRG